MTAILARILLRYAIGAFILKGFIDPTLGDEIVNDPQIAMLIETGIGLAAGGIVEAWMYFTMPSAEATKAADAVDAGKVVTIEAQPKEVIENKDAKEGTK